MTMIKICGLSRREDVEFVNEARPDFAGFVIDFPKSRRSVSPHTAHELRLRLEHGITPVGVFVDSPVDTVADLFFSGAVKIAQLHGSEDGDYIAALRRAAPGLAVWRAFRVRSAADIAAAEASEADMVLLDNGQGTGESFDWSLIRGIRRDFVLAGGLTPETIPEAVRALHPWAVDISSGVETENIKDRTKILAAVGAARKEGDT